MSEKLSFLDGPPPAGSEGASAPQTAAPASAGESAAAAVQRDEQGRFAPAASAAPPATATEPGAAAPPPPEPGHVPISALLDEREKRQAEKAAREALERRLAQIEASRQAPPPMTRDEQLEAALYDQNLRSSRRFAEREYGKDTIAAVHDWAARRCDEDPQFNQQMRASADPYEAAYQAYHREQILQTVKPNDLAAFKAWQAAQAGAGQINPGAGAAGAVSHAAAAAVPRSLATASGTGGAGAPHVPVGPGMAFASAINR